MHWLLRVIDVINRVVCWILGGLLFAMTLSTLWQVIVRFAPSLLGINIAASWTEEFARYAMIWMIFLGAAVACRRAQLIALDLIIMKSPKMIGVALKFVSLIICLIFFGLMTQLGIEFLDFGWIEFSPVLSVSKVWVYLSMPIGFSLMFLNTVTLMLEAVIYKKDIRLTDDGGIE